MYKRVLIVGSHGQLAFDLIQVFKQNGAKIIKANHSDFDVAKQHAVSKFIKAAKPDLVINTAAFHKTAECEFNPKKSFDVNALGAFNVAKAAKEVGATVIFFSTNYVFDGTGKIYNEDGHPNPINVYGASKLAGETLTKVANPNHYVIRTSGLFGVHRSGKGYNFVSLMFEKAKGKVQTDVVNDEFTSVTYTKDLALKVLELIKKNAPYGIYHLANSGTTSWYEVAKEVFRKAKALKYINSVTSKERPSSFARPASSGLTSKQLKLLGIKDFRDWKKAVGEYLDELD